MSKQIHKTEKGHLGQYEDWWNFDADQQVVTHHWDHVTVNGLSSKSGHESYSVEEFLSGSHHEGAKAALRKEIDT